MRPLGRGGTRRTFCSTRTTLGCARRRSRTRAKRVSLPSPSLVLRAMMLTRSAPAQVGQRRPGLHVGVPSPSFGPVSCVADLDHAGMSRSSPRRTTCRACRRTSGSKALFDKKRRGVGIRGRITGTDVRIIAQGRMYGLRRGMALGARMERSQIEDCAGSSPVCSNK